MSWKDVLKKEEEVFPNLETITRKYTKKIDTIIGMLKNMKKKINYKNVKDELIMPTRPMVYGPYQKEFTQEELDELINRKITNFNLRDENVKEIMSENRPLKIPNLAEFQIGYQTPTTIDTYLKHVPKELRDKFIDEFGRRHDDGTRITPTLGWHELKDWIDKQKQEKLQ